MPIDSNIEDLEKLILGQSEYVEKDVPQQLTKLVGDIQQQLIGGDYKQQSGDLRKSIRVTLDDYQLTIEMLNYGYFQSFGVRGTKGGNAIGLPSDVAGAFGVNEGYQFQFKSKVISEESGLPYPARKKIAEFGIKPKDFYPTDIEDAIINILEKPYE